VNGGHVRVNGERARGATSVRVGDEIRLVRQQSAYALKILAIPARRGPAKDAQACYEESPESAARRERQLAELRRDRMQMPMTKGKPDKHTRRQLRDRKGR
jgi:ribosome-associated heat shock protein Hsp15